MKMNYMYSICLEWFLSKRRGVNNNRTFVCLPAGAANHHNQSTLRPPLPPPHNHQSLSHQSANSLNRNTLRGGRNPIHAPTPGTGDGPTTPESVQLQDSWVLNSNVPLETRSEHTSSLLLSFVFNVCPTPITRATKSQQWNGPWVINGKDWKVGVLQIQHHSCEQQTAAATGKKRTED